MDDGSRLKIGKRTFMASFLILVALLFLVGILTRFIPTGSYEREIVNGRELLVQDSFHYTQADKLPLYKIMLAPLLVFVSPDALKLSIIILFLLIIGGSVHILNTSHVLTGIIQRIIHRFRNNKYILLSGICFVFMLFGAVMGIFEEVVPMVPIMIALAYCLGWDALVGMGMVILASGFGFAAAVSNPFTIGVAQEIAGLPMFSGALFRIIIFIGIYALLLAFLIPYAKKVEKDPKKSLLYKVGVEHPYKNSSHSNEEWLFDPKIKRGIIFFQIMILCLFLVLFLGVFIESLLAYSMPIVGIIFLIAGVGSGLVAGMPKNKIIPEFFRGCLGIAPGILLLLVAASVKYVITEAGVMDTLLFHMALAIKNTHPAMGILLVYFLVLFLNFFIGSGSAKAFLIMPIVLPLADMMQVNRQVMVLAFQLGDGFSNILYPTNPVLLISLGLGLISYRLWFKFTIKLQLLMVLISIITIELALFINYGPF